MFTRRRQKHIMHIAALYFSKLRWNVAIEVCPRVSKGAKTGQHLVSSIRRSQLGRHAPHHHILHICHNRWLCKRNQVSVKFLDVYVKETALVLHKMCSFTKKVCNLHKFWNVYFYTVCNFTQCVILHIV